MSDFKMILDKWVEYTNYNPNQKRFNLLTNEYRLRETSKVMEILLNDYDSTGALSAIKAKMTFEIIMKTSKVSLGDILKDPNCIAAEMELYQLLQSEDIVEAEKTLFHRVNEICILVTGRTFIGEWKEVDAQKLLLRYTEMVVNEIYRCNEDVYRIGGKIQPITNISDQIHAFETLALCLTTLDQAKDGLYTCYINAGGSAEGYFGYFIINNGNFFSLHDRIDESYQGEHLNSRNTKWTDEKRMGLFPYSFISLSRHDYNGYVTAYNINSERLRFSSLKEEQLYPILITMALIGSKYVGRKLTGPIKYVDSLLPENIGFLEQEKNGVMSIDTCSLVKSHRELLFSFDNEKILAGAYTKEFSIREEKNTYECGYFTNQNQMMIDLWGRGFQFQSEGLLRSNSGNIKSLINVEKKGSIPAELVGTEERFRVQAYFQIRKQLAAYMRSKIHEEFLKTGGADSVYEWFHTGIRNNLDLLKRLAVECCINYISHNRTTLENNTKEYVIEMSDHKQRYSQEWNTFVINHTRDHNDYICPITGKASNVFFTYIPESWKALEYLVGKKTPKILQGWGNRSKHYGDDLLNITDAAAVVSTPFDDWEAWRMYKEDYKNTNYDFKFALGMDKTGLYQMIKETGYII